MLKRQAARPVTAASIARYVHWRIRQPHDHAWHRAATWPYRAIFGTVAPTGTMYDDIAATGDPAGGDGYAGYLNGKFNDYADTKARFPDKPTKSISVWGMDLAALLADIADCEDGDYTPVLVALWAHLKITGGYGRPTIYSSTSQYGDIATALAAYGLAFGRDVDWWEAHYDGLAMISSNPGAIGKQYQSTDNYDVSIVYMGWLLGNTPAPSPTPPTPTEDDMYVLVVQPPEKNADGTTQAPGPENEAVAILPPFGSGTAVFSCDFTPQQCRIYIGGPINGWRPGPTQDPDGWVGIPVGRQLGVPFTAKDEVISIRHRGGNGDDNHPVTVAIYPA